MTQGRPGPSSPGKELLVYLAPVDWAANRQRPQHLALWLADRFDLVYVNPVGLRSIRWSDAGRVARRLFGRRGQDAPFPVASPLFLPWEGSSAVDRLNEAFLWRQLAPVLESGRPFTLWVGSPSRLALTVLRRCRPARVVYDCMDHYAGFHPGANGRRVAEAEKEVLDAAHLAVASSEVLAERLRSLHPNVALVPNGADVERFLRQSARPPQQGERPILGFVGTIGDWVDFELLGRLAEARRDCRVVLVGPWVALGGRELLRHPNVEWAGELSWKDVPGFAAGFTAGLIPFRTDEVGRYVNPIKLYEYLALGLPVVSTGLPEVRRHSQCVHLADTAEGFIEAVGAALGGGAGTELSSEHRRRYAADFSWERQFGRLEGCLSGDLGRRSPAGPQGALGVRR